NQPLELISLLNNILTTEHTAELVRTILEAAVNLAKGTRGIMVLDAGPRYRTEQVWPQPEKPKKKPPRMTIRKNSKLAALLQQKGSCPIEQSQIDEKYVKKELKPAADMECWCVVPFITAGELVGLVVVGNQPAKPPINTAKLSLFSAIASFFLKNIVFNRSIDDIQTSADREKKELEGMVDAFDFTQISDTDIQSGLEDVAQRFDMEAAVLVTGWERKGSLEVAAEVGLSELERKKYRVAKSDKQIKRILREKHPGIPEDADKKIDRLSVNGASRITRYVVAPIHFHNQLLGVLNIHKMKGIGKKLTRNSRLKLHRIAQVFVPYLLYQKLTEAKPEPSE
ncbi:MAG: hypothetical protein ACOC7U_05990, partial [Spirochaetota bacterium]